MASPIRSPQPLYSSTPLKGGKKVKRNRIEDETCSNHNNTSWNNPDIDSMLCNMSLDFDGNEKKSKEKSYEAEESQFQEEIHKIRQAKEDEWEEEEEQEGEKERSFYGAQKSKRSKKRASTPRSPYTPSQSLASKKR